MYRHLARCAGMAAVVLAAAWPISVYTAYGWEAALVHAPIAAAVYIMLLNALVMPLLGIHSARNDHPPRRYSSIALVAEICFILHHQAGKFLQGRLPENVPLIPLWLGLPLAVAAYMLVPGWICRFASGRE
ncbi:hypothetical protein [Kingella denitrificans]